ncbi:hypothetical protein Vi05172_g9999 [Venturia inaequalis]|nr:hypothetical protein Vi05172_g9999 [Venturia inaequalis]
MEVPQRNIPLNVDAAFVIDTQSKKRPMKPKQPKLPDKMHQSKPKPYTPEYACCTHPSSPKEMVKTERHMYTIASARRGSR